MATKCMESLKWVFLVMVFSFQLMPGTTQGQSGNTLEEEKFGTYTPNAGFRVVTTDKGTLNFKLFTYLRYRNKLGLDSTYTNAFGNASAIDRRQDLQVKK